MYVCGCSFAMVLYELVTRCAIFDGSSVPRERLPFLIINYGTRPDLAPIERLKNEIIGSEDRDVIMLLEELIKLCWESRPEKRSGISEGDFFLFPNLWKMFMLGCCQEWLTALRSNTYFDATLIYEIEFFLKLLRNDYISYSLTRLYFPTLATPLVVRITKVDSIAKSGFNCHPKADEANMK